MKRENYQIPQLLRYLCVACIIALGLASIIATGGGGGSSSGGGTGELSVSLSDATTDEYNAVYVTVKEVQAHMADDKWEVVGTPEKTYNLLELVNGVREELGIASLAPGSYTQMRMIIGDTPDNGINILSQSHPYANYIIDKLNNYHELKIPSGFQTGIKIVHGFDINANQTTELILDFDASKSVVKAGNSGKWLLEPTIKVINSDDYSVISGMITDDDESDAMPLEGVLVSAQTSDPNAADLKDAVMVQTSTITDEDGLYTIFVEPGTYNMVAYHDGFELACSSLDALPDSSHGLDFTLSEAETGTISGDVQIIGGIDEQYVTLSFRQTVSCDGTDEKIEVKSINIANNGHYVVILPAGTYDVVASTYGKATKESQDVDVTSGGDTLLDIMF